MRLAQFANLQGLAIRGLAVQGISIMGALP